jgi:hypothetical protein
MTDQERIKQNLKRLLRSGVYELREDGTTIYLVPIARECQYCGRRYIPGQKKARYCSTKCRVYAWRQRMRSGHERFAKGEA